MLEEVENHMILADGSANPFYGKGTLELEVEGKRAPQEIWIAGIELEGILGMDFVCRYGCQIVAAHGGQLKLFIPKLTSASGRVRTGPGKPGKSWNFVMAFSRTGKSWKKATGPGKSWKSV